MATTLKEEFMQILLNGKSHTLNKESTLEQLIEEFCKNNKHIIVELNGAIIKSQSWEKTFIKDGDQIELVTIVGGG